MPEENWKAERIAKRLAVPFAGHDGDHQHVEFLIRSLALEIVELKERIGYLEKGQDQLAVAIIKTADPS